MAAGAGNSATAIDEKLEYAFRRYASKAGCQEATVQDLFRWYHDAGVFDVAHATCNNAKLTEVFNSVKTTRGTKKQVSIDKSPEKCGPSVGGRPSRVSIPQPALGDKGRTSIQQAPSEITTVNIQEAVKIIHKLSPFYAEDMDIDDPDEALSALTGDLMAVCKGPNDTTGEIPDLERQFRHFAMKGGSTQATLKDVIHWFTDAGVFIHSKKCNQNSVDIAFTAIKQKGKTAIDVDEMDKLLARLAPEYASDHGMTEDVALARLYQMLSDTQKMQHGATKPTHVGGVQKLTDSTKYTGMHKGRFDEEGKGKGKEVVELTGYVGNYKGAGTYDDTHTPGTRRGTKN